MSGVGLPGWGNGAGEYITAYIIHTMRGGAQGAYLEASARYGLCQRAILLLLRALLAGRAAHLADLPGPGDSAPSGAYFA
jgi:hypothetical protein